jgi:hypothetical protein
LEAPDQLRAVEAKIERVLAQRPQCFITHPTELHALKQLSPEQLRDFATKRGWRTVRRLGGRQIEFYNDVSARTAM